MSEVINPPVAPVDSSSEQKNEVATTQDQSLDQVKETPQPRRLKVKVDEIEQELDEAEVIKGYQRAQAANKRFEEASKLKKQSEKFLEQLQKDPFKILADPRLGVNAREVAEKYILEQLENEMMSPEEIQARQEKAELDQYRKEKESQKKQQEEEKSNQVKQKYVEDYTKQFQSALEQVSIPKTPETVKRMAQYLQASIKGGYETPISEIAEMVREDYINEQKSIVSQLSGQDLIRYFGEDVAKKIRQQDLSRLENNFVSKLPAPEPERQSKKSQDMDPFEFREFIRKKNGL